MKNSFVLLVLFFSACSNHNSAPDESFKALSVPLAIDTDFIIKQDTSQKLTYSELRAFGTTFMAHESTQDLVSVINEACKIDSLKQKGAYKNYTDHLDIGMTKDAIAYKIGKVTFGDNSCMLLWGIQNASYEACPSFSGTYIIGSYKTKDKGYIHALLGENSSWADPPSTAGKVITTSIKANGEFSSVIKNESDDLDVAGANISNTNIDFQTDHDALKVMKIAKKVVSVETAVEQ